MRKRHRSRTWAHMLIAVPVAMLLMDLGGSILTLMRGPAAVRDHVAVACEPPDPCEDVECNSCQECEDSECVDACPAGEMCVCPPEGVGGGQGGGGEPSCPRQGDPPNWVQICPGCDGEWSCLPLTAECIAPDCGDGCSCVAKGDGCGVCDPPFQGTCDTGEVATSCGCEADSDGDGTADCEDECPNDPDKTEEGSCGCGVQDTPGCCTEEGLDTCPDDPNKNCPGQCGCGEADTDTDADGTADCRDTCPDDPNKKEPGVCGCGVPDDTPDCCEDGDCCPEDPDKKEPGQCGCGVPDTDDDGDGTANCRDQCPDDPEKTAPGVCGCGVSDTADSDGDGTVDCKDGCPDDEGKTYPGLCGCGVPDTDTDIDGTPDCHDACPTDLAKTSPGQCGCGVPDVDSDGDGRADCIDGCPEDENKTSPGKCGCGIPDDTPDCCPAGDCCPEDPDKTEPGQCGCGVADNDTDNDGTADCIDGCPNDPNKTAPGQCGCGVVDADSDGDGAFDCLDGCPDDPNKTGPGKCGCSMPETCGGDDPHHSDCSTSLECDSYYACPGDVIYMPAEATNHCRVSEPLSWTTSLDQGGISGDGCYGFIDMVEPSGWRDFLTCVTVSTQNTPGTSGGIDLTVEPGCDSTCHDTAALNVIDFTYYVPRPAPTNDPVSTYMPDHNPFPFNAYKRSFTVITTPPGLESLIEGWQIKVLSGGDDIDGRPVADPGSVSQVAYNEWLYTGPLEMKVSKNPNRMFGVQLIPIVSNTPICSKSGPDRVFFMVASKFEYYKARNEWMNAHQFIVWKYGDVLTYYSAFNSVEIVDGITMSGCNSSDYACTQLWLDDVQFNRSSLATENVHATVIGHESIHAEFDLFNGDECHAYTWEIEHQEGTGIGFQPYGINDDYLRDAIEHQGQECE